MPGLCPIDRYSQVFELLTHMDSKLNLSSTSSLATK